MDYKQELDRVYSLYIRLRDAFDGGYTQCISCGRILPFHKMQLGHYFSRRHMATRWDEQNCNAECETCNCRDTNHLVGYKKNLINKIGQRAFEELEERHKRMEDEPTEDEYKELIIGYKKCCRMLAKAKGISVSI